MEGKEDPSSGSQDGQGLDPTLFFGLYLFIFVFIFFFISWRLITLQYCSGFCHTLT